MTRTNGDIDPHARATANVFFLYFYFLVGVVVCVFLSFLSCIFFTPRVLCRPAMVHSCRGKRRREGGRKKKGKRKQTRMYVQKNTVRHFFLFIAHFVALMSLPSIRPRAHTTPATPHRFRPTPRFGHSGPFAKNRCAVCVCVCVCVYRCVCVVDARLKRSGQAMRVHRTRHQPSRRKGNAARRSDSGWERSSCTLRFAHDGNA